MLRFATSPTGDMHINTLRVAILNYLIAQQKDENFSVRIEDIESEKNIEGKDTEIMMILEKFALKHDSVFHQTQHLNLHQTLALRLLKEKKAFICKCTDETSSINQYENLSIEEQNSLKENKTPITICTKESDVILKSDKTPTYDFAAACDDMMSSISLIICQEEYLSHAPKQIHFKKLLGYEEETEYIAIPTIIDRENRYTIKWLFEQGYIPDAILNYLLLIGYKNAPKEIFKLPEAIEWFKLENISKSSVEFDIEKLNIINREHLKEIDDKELSKLFGFADADIGKLAKLYLKELSTINELKQKIEAIFKPKDFRVDCGEEMKIIANIIANAPAFSTFKKFKEDIILKSGLDEDSISKPLKYLLTGTDDDSVALSEIYPFIKSYILEVAS